MLVTRPADQAAALSDRLRVAGAEPVEAPMIAIRPAADPARLARMLAAARKGAFDWVAFTSANAVTATADGLPPGDARIAVVGPGTAEALGRHGVRPDLVAERSTGAGLADALLAASPPGRILLPRADLAAPTLPDALRDAGWTVEEVEAYRTTPVTDFPPGVRDRVAAGSVEVVTFGSASAVRAFAELFGGPPPAGVRVASIGPVTTRACGRLGIRVDAEADPHDLDGLVDAVRTAAGYPRRV